MITRTIGTDDEDAARMLKDTLQLEFSMDAMNLVRWVRDTFYPEDVFPEDELETWAKDNGWVKEE